MDIKTEIKYGTRHYCYAVNKYILNNKAITKCYNNDKTKYVILTPEIKNQILEDIEFSKLKLIKDDYIGETSSKINGKPNSTITYNNYRLTRIIGQSSNKKNNSKDNNKDKNSLKKVLW